MDTKELYREILNEHNLNPSHKKDMEGATISLNGINPSCGDNITLNLKVEDGIIVDGSFTGSGCAVSQASCDMMLDLVIGKTVEEAAEELAKSGKSAEEVKYLKKYKSFPGNRPTNTIVVKKVDPYTLGMLVAMYEHKVFVQGVIWNIDSFDQMGVELGKQMALSILPELQGNAYNEHDSSTSGLISLIKKIRK